MLPASPRLYTVGHSNRSLRELIDLLAAAGVQSLVDVRRVPRSGRHPQFNEEVLREGLGGAGIVYHWAGRQLGGRRESRPDSPHRALEEAFRGYAEYMETDAFQRAAAQLASLALRTRVAVLCAEREPDHCHRSLIADYLTLGGAKVLHLVAPGETREHRLNPALRLESARPVYDRGVSRALDFDA